MACIVGVDPGLSGAVAVISEKDGAIKSFSDFPKIGKRLDLTLLYELLREIKQKDKPRRVFLEKSQAMPNQGSVSMFNYGVTFGHLESCVAALKLPYELVAPRTWTAYMHKGLSKSLTAKERSLQLARSLYPDETFTFTERQKKPHDGVIDALLLAEFGRMKLKGATERFPE